MKFVRKTMLSILEVFVLQFWHVVVKGFWRHPQSEWINRDSQML